MKKFAIICILLFCSIFYVACKSDEMHELGLKNESICVELNESKTLEELGFEFSNKYNINDFSFIYDSDYISYENLNFKFEKPGKTELIVFLKTGENRVERKCVEIEVVLGESLEFKIVADEVFIDIQDELDLISNVSINESLKQYLVFKDENKIVLNNSYKGLEVKRIKVFVEFHYQEQVLNLGDFYLNILNNVYVESVGLSNANVYELYNDSSGVIDFNILPFDANVFEIISRSESFDINNNGEYNAKSAIENFEVWVKYKNLEKEECTKVYNFKIIEKVEIEDVEVYKKEVKVLGAFVGSEDYEIKITFNKIFDKNLIVFGRGIEVVEDEVENNKYSCVVNFNEDCVLEFSYLNIDSFLNISENKFELHDFEFLSVDDLNICFKNNLNNELTFGNEIETLYLIDESLASGYDINHAYWVEVSCFIGETLINFNINVSDEYFEYENGKIKPIKDINLTYICVEIYGKAFEFGFKIEEIETDISISGYDEILYYNSDNNKTSFEVEYGCEYSTKIKNLAVEYDENFLKVDLKNKTIEVIDYDFSKGSNKFEIKFAIGDNNFDISILVEPKITKVVLKDLNNENEYDMENILQLNKEEAFSYKMILFSKEEAIVINFEIFIEIYIFENDKFIITDNQVDYLKSYNKTMNFAEFYEGGEYLVKFNSERFDDEIHFYLNVA